MKRGNRAYYAYKVIITSILINKINKKNTHMTLIRPEVIYASEFWHCLYANK